MARTERELLALAAGYLATPYRLHGASAEAWDCLGLVRVLRRDLFGLSTPYGAGFYRKRDAVDPDRRAAMFDEGRRAWTPCEARPGAVALFQDLGRANHVGLMLTTKTFIHARDETTGTVIEDMAGPWARRLVGYFDARD